MSVENEKNIFHGIRITIIEAAIKVKDGTVYTGKSHADIIQAQPKDFFKNTEDIKTTIQGFVTSEGEFVDRKKGGKIAYEAGQIKKLTTVLFSEDITGDWYWSSCDGKRKKQKKRNR